mmetsp:Transcript_3451/g.7441  ORF Transcript_3451/g.7441 Transcript_3451/m.7441 type:complete len:106 (+) Transcript_3451:749-1066(+)
MSWVGYDIVDTITIQCNTLNPFATLKICIQDPGGELLAPNDNATVPKCCHSIVPKETQTVCYNLAISCSPDFIISVDDPGSFGLSEDNTAGARNLRGIPGAAINN